MTATSSYSLLKRLTVAFSTVAILVFALTGAFLYNALSTELQRRDDIEISGKLSQFLQLARDTGSAQTMRNMPSVFHEVLLSHAGVYLAIFDRQGAVLLQHPDKSPVDLAPMPATHRPNAPYNCEPQSYRIDIWLAVAVGAALVGALGYAVARRGFSPVRSIGRQTSRIEAHNLSERLDIEGGPVELQDIASSVNRMLDRLERAFVRLSQFSSDLAHDMRTPLANVISSSQVTLSRSRSTEEYEALIESNIEECERLQRMIENMLFLARTDNAQQLIKVAEFDAESELRRLASYFQGLAEEAGVQIAVEGNTWIAADATLFRRAVSNLISNALDHAFAGSSVELSSFDSPKYAVVQVTNRGDVIAPEHVDRIFERFYRIDASRHGSARNAGLGLAIVRSIMELHRGKVDVASGSERTTFTLYFPRPVAV